MTVPPRPARQAVEPRPSRNAQKVSVNIAEGDKENGRRFHLQVSECVETKTVTTTTRLTRKFPPVFLRDPVPLDILDHKEYPLALKPTPPELLEFSYEELDEEPDEESLVGEAFDEENRDDALDNQIIARQVRNSVRGTRRSFGRPKDNADEPKWARQGGRQHISTPLIPTYADCDLTRSS